MPREAGAAPALTGGRGVAVVRRAQDSVRTFRRDVRAALAVERRAQTAAYLVPTLLAALAVQTWFEPGTVIAAGDLPPPFAPAASYTSHWSHFTAGEGAPAYSIVSLPYAGWLEAWNWVGADEELGQRLWLTLLFAGSAAAVVFLAFGFSASSLAAGVAGLLAVFNAYRLILGPDAIPVAALIVSALLGGFIARVALRPERPVNVIGFAVSSVGLGYVMTNPPHVVLVLLWVALCVAIVLAAEPAATGRMFRFLVRAVPLALLLNVWWIVPAWLTITNAGFGEQFAAAGVDEWTWTHERATFANALTLNTTWAWSYPEYFPYAERLEGLPFGPLKLLLPVLAVAGVLLAPRRMRRIALGLGLTGLVGVWLATGVRGPLPGVNRWLYDYVPGFWLFREPTKLLLLVLLPAAVLAGVGVSRLLDRDQAVWTRALAVSLVAGAVIYVHPLLTGEVIADARPLLPPAHTDVPDAWRRAAAALNGAPGSGKVLVLPRSDFYQVPTTWGYYGVPFTRSLIRRPVFEAQPGGYFRPKREAALLEESVESDLLDGRVGDLPNKLRALGVEYVLLRRDIDLDFPDRRFARPAALARSLDRAHGVRRFGSYRLLDIYRVDAFSGHDVFAATPAFYAGSPGALGGAMNLVRGAPGFVSEEEDQQSVAHSGVRPESVLRFEEDVVRRVAVRAERGMLHVRLADPFRLSLGRSTLPSLPAQRVAAPLLSGVPLVVRAGSSVFRLQTVPPRWVDLGLVGLKPGEAVSVWTLAGRRSIHPRAAGAVGDCNAFDGRGLDEVGIRSAVMGSTLRLSARAHSACVHFPLVPERSGDVYRVRFLYRQRQGSPPRVCLWQSGKDRCAQAPDLRAARTWQVFDATISPDRAATALTLFVYADGQGRSSPTVVEYRGFRLERYRRFVNVPHARPRRQVLPRSTSARRTLGFAPLVVSRAVDVRSAGAVGDCNRYDERTPAQVGLASRVLARSDSPVLQLAARDHSACVDFAISPAAPTAGAYRIRFEYRRLRGSPPRACLWQSGPDRCVPFSGLASDRDWRLLDETVQLDRGVRALRLVLYADGDARGATVTEYRNIHVGPVGSVAIIGLPRRQPLPRIVARRQAPWKFRVRVTDARTPFLLVASEAFSSGWKARADGRRDSDLRHVQVNGYANGWLVPWKGSYELTLEYEPERYARAGRWLSVIAAPLVVLAWIGRRRIRRFSHVPKH